MKLALVIVAIVVLLWLLKGAFAARRGGGPAAPPKKKGAAAPMLQCAECGVHLPRDEALPGKGGVYCSDAHRVLHER